MSAKTRAELRESLKGIDSEDTSIVVNGSLARDEYTEGSDIDWTLLIDGTADPGHFHVLGRVQEIVGKVEGKRPGAEGTFGAMVFSHNLVHEIGGEDDTNINLTRRLLLLLESSSVGRPDAHDRVVRNILSRYLLEDRGFWAGSRYRVPRFLQNDFARYWRTMAVDFAYKLRKRSGKGWAIRNMKLRMSRKLIYVSGLLACFRCHSAYGREAWAELTATMDGKMKIVDEMELVFARTPLSILAGELARHEHLGGAAAAILTAYDEFLGLLANQETRDRLEELEEEAAGTDKVYQQARDCSHRFRDGLLELFFDEQSGLGELTRNYGVF